VRAPIREGIQGAEAEIPFQLGPPDAMRPMIAEREFTSTAVDVTESSLIWSNSEGSLARRVANAISFGPRQAPRRIDESGD
jgi:hypothetical protein